LKEDKIVGTCSTNWEERNAYRKLVGKPKGKRSLRRIKRRWNDNIEIDIIQDEVVWTGVIWLRIAESEGPL
jgi:hypothetical protein